MKCFVESGDSSYESSLRSLLYQHSFEDCCLNCFFALKIVIDNILLTGFILVLLKHFLGIEQKFQYRYGA